MPTTYYGTKDGWCNVCKQDKISYSSGADGYTQCGCGGSDFWNREEIMREKKQESRTYNEADNYGYK